MNIFRFNQSYLNIKKYGALKVKIFLICILINFENALVGVILVKKKIRVVPIIMGIY